MTAPVLRSGQAVSIQKRLAAGCEAIRLYASLTDRGARADTLLLENAGGTALIFDQSAVRIQCRGQDAELQALTTGGLSVLQAIAERLAANVIARIGSTLRLRFTKPTGADSELRLLAPNPFDALRALLFDLESLSKEEPFTLLGGGIVAFDHVDFFEDLPQAESDPLDFPDFIFWLAESLVVVEPGAGVRLICTAYGDDDPGVSERAYHSAVERLSGLALRCEAAAQADTGYDTTASGPAATETVDLSDPAYCAVVADLKQRIVAGDVYQIVPSRTFRADCPDPLASFASLRALDPSPYMFFVSCPDHVLFGASPETSVKVTRPDRWATVELKPIAGTRGRGATADEDDRVEADLRLDAKEAAEHMMLVDLARNDIARISIPGTRRVAALLDVHRFARVMHLVSSVEGRLGLGFDSIHALQACLNVGTLCGAPKLRAMQLLRETEATKRGPYGGAVGWISGNGEMDTGVVIRSATVRNGVAYVRAGAGVVFDSEPQSEAEETRRKAAAILAALGADGARA